MADQTDKKDPGLTGSTQHPQAAPAGAAHGGKDVRHDQTALRQSQANHFKAMMDDCSKILNDPNTPQVLKDEAQGTYDDMVANLSRLQVKYGVNPQ